MKIRNFILLFAIIILSVRAYPAFGSSTKAGSTIESAAVLYYEAGIVSSETNVTTVEQMYGSSFEPAALWGMDAPGATHYFSHKITNVGNGTDSFAFTLMNATPEFWGFSLISDEGNRVHDTYDNVPLDNPLLLAEDAEKYFFVAMSVPASAEYGSWGRVKLSISGEVSDGGTYTGANGIVYGGPDTHEATDVLTLEGLKDLKINRDDSTGFIYLSWTGGALDIYSMQGTYDATFAGQIKEGTAESSPFYCVSLQAKDGKTRYYRVAPTGTTSYLPQVMGKFDVPVRVGLNELSSPLVLYQNDLSHIVGRQASGESNATTADRIWRYNPAVQGGYDIAWLVDKVNPTYNGKWFTGNAPTTLTIGTDEGYILEIRTGHTASYITMIGEVSTVNRTIEVKVGMNVVGSCFPVVVTLEASNLLQSGMTGANNASAADRFWKYNPAVQGSYDIAWLVNGVGPAYNGKWFTGNYPTTLKILPGYSYRIEVRSTHSPFTWNYKKPY